MHFSDLHGNHSWKRLKVTQIRKIQSAASVVRELREDLTPETFIKSFTDKKLLALIEMFDEYLDLLRTNLGTHASFWMSYIDIVTLLLQFVRASRERSWSLHLASIKAIIPWCFAYDRINYARYLPAYYYDMQHLKETSPAVYEHMEHGGFAAQVGKSRNPFGSIPVDQTIEETINKDTKTAGGTTRFSLNPAAVQKHYLTAEYRSIFLGNLGDFVGLNSSQLYPSDLSSGRITKDEADVQAVVDVLEENWINPFDGTSRDLTSLSTSAVPSKNIKEDLLQAKEKGQHAYQKFCEERLNSSTKKFHDKIQTMRLKTFSNMTKKGRMVQLQGQETMLRADRNLFGNMIISAQSRKIWKQFWNTLLVPCRGALPHQMGFQGKQVNLFLEMLSSKMSQHQDRC